MWPVRYQVSHLDAKNNSQECIYFVSLVLIVHVPTNNHAAKSNWENKINGLNTIEQYDTDFLGHIVSLLVNVNGEQRGLRTIIFRKNVCTIYIVYTFMERVGIMQNIQNMIGHE